MSPCCMETLTVTDLSHIWSGSGPSVSGFQLEAIGALVVLLLLMFFSYLLQRRT